MDEIRNVTFGLWGEELSHEQTIQRLVNAGFPIKAGVLVKMFAIIEGESGEYQRAWHANVLRDPAKTGSIVYDAGGRMTIQSIDLGFAQRNIEVSPDLKIAPTEDAMKVFVDGMFDKHPDLAVPVTAAEDAFAIWTERGFAPWFAYKPGTAAWWVKLKEAHEGLIDWSIHSFLGPDPDTGKLPRMDWVRP